MSDGVANAVGLVVAKILEDVKIRESRQLLDLMIIFSHALLGITSYPLAHMKVQFEVKV